MRGKERHKVRSDVRGATKGEKNRCFENTGKKTVKVCFSKNVTVGVITGDVSSLTEEVVNTLCESDNS